MAVRTTPSPTRRRRSVGGLCAHWRNGHGLTRRLRLTDRRGDPRYEAPRTTPTLVETSRLLRIASALRGGAARNREGRRRCGADGHARLRQNAVRSPFDPRRRSPEPLAQGTFPHARAGFVSVLWRRVLPELSSRNVKVGESRGFETRRVAPACLDSDSVSARAVRASVNSEYHGIDLAWLDVLTSE